jgi:hypothetical protein
MATLTISLSGSAVVNGSKNYTVSDADIQTLLNWAGRFAPGVTPQSTAAQILVAWANWMIANTVTAVKQDQLGSAAAAATAAVTPISIA